MSWEPTARTTVHAHTRDGYSFVMDGLMHEVELGVWDSVLIEWWLSVRDWRWADA